MQIQAVCLPAIQLIPYYRGIQAKRMGRMDTQLMCAPGFRYERNKSTPRIIMQHSIISHGRFSVNRIDHLPRPVFRIRAEGEFNMTFFFLHNAIQPSNISFTHRPVLELCLQVLVHFFRLGYKDTSVALARRRNRYPIFRGLTTCRPVCSLPTTIRLHT